MNTLYQLEKLRNNVSYLEWLFELSTEANARQRLQRYKEAKQELKEFKAKYYPHLLQQPKFPAFISSAKKQFSKRTFCANVNLVRKI